MAISMAANRFYSLLHPIGTFVAHDILCVRRAAELTKHGAQCNFGIKKQSNYVLVQTLVFQPIFMTLAGKVGQALQRGTNTFEVSYH